MTSNAIDGYIGTYYSEKSRGIYHFSFDPESGRMTEPELFYEAPNAKWVSAEGNCLAVPVERQGRAGTCFLELVDGAVSREEEILKEHQTPCYILQKDGYVYTANYHEGNVMVYHLGAGKPSLVKRIENGERAGCHQILLHEGDLMVPCLEQDRIRIFDRKRGFEPAGEIRFPEGSGPRHGVFNREHTRFYVVSEWSNELFLFTVKGRGFILDRVLPVLPEDGKERNADAASAAIRLAGNERFLYISVRGADLVAVFEIREDAAAGTRIRPIQYVSCGGVHPRDMILSADERFLLVVNRYEGGIVCMERDMESGLLGAVRHRILLPEGVALAFGKKDRQEAVI
ncbi:beta-propeller fold lactonase family protein [Clostridium sp. AN503]|uniref:lactonase family protein n=1 Tax=Clostridium sp. AN503 TaxID=3160598 RepID=UPI0034584CE9